MICEDVAQKMIFSSLSFAHVGAHYIYFPVLMSHKWIKLFHHAINLSLLIVSTIQYNLTYANLKFYHIRKICMFL